MNETEYSKSNNNQMANLISHDRNLHSIANAWVLPRETRANLVHRVARPFTSFCIWAWGGGGSGSGLLSMCYIGMRMLPLLEIFFHSSLVELLLASLLERR